MAEASSHQRLRRGFSTDAPSTSAAYDDNRAYGELDTMGESNSDFTPDSSPADGEGAPSPLRRPSAHGAHMSFFSRRVASFQAHKWKRDLFNGNLTNPTVMAETGWYCTGPDSVRCYACNKEMEEWETADNPVEIHEERCPDCPLNIHRPVIPGQMTWREQIRLDTAIAFHHKSIETRQMKLRMKMAFEVVRLDLQRKLAALREEE